MLRNAGFLLQPITYPNMDILVLLLANPIVFFTFTREFLLMAFGLNVSILVSILGCHALLLLVVSGYLDIFSLVDDAIYASVFTIGRLTQFTQALMEVFFLLISGALGQFSIGRLTQFNPDSMDAFIRSIGRLTQFTHASRQPSGSGALVS